jgi:uncharacterized protein (DUF2235 family)
MNNNKLARLQPIEPGSLAMGKSVAATGGGASTSPVPAIRAEQSQTFAQQIRAAYACYNQVPANSYACHKHLQVSVFFDGTGNNRNADLPTLEHSNVVRMFHAHLVDDPVTGVFRRYVPGIGTLFPEIGDDGSGLIGPGMGAKGQDRLDWAFKEVQDIITKAEPMCKEIKMISISVFGFSRGATAARAFVRDMLDPEKGYTEVQGQSITWKRGQHPAEIRFLGIWDTVASVGAVMSANNVMAVRSKRRVATNVARGTALAAVHTSPTDLTAKALAFGTPGADPSPGTANGHGSWANGLQIPEGMVKRCVHMVAGHEQRNSFPSDSVMLGHTMPANTEEMVYPGMHSDVGGGYRPGEQGKGRAVPANKGDAEQCSLQLSQIALRAMYDRALAAGVPLRLMNGPQWGKQNKDDFVCDPDMLSLFTHYTQHARADGLPLGDAMLAHMRVLFSWRFQHIRSGARQRQDNPNIANNEKIWNDDAHTLKAQRDLLEAQRSSLVLKRSLALRDAWKSIDTRKNPTLLPQPGDAGSPALAELDGQVEDIERRLKEIKAKEDTLPSRDSLIAHLAEYDAQLLEDAISIHQEVAGHPAKRAQLRPHYRNLLEAYEDEYLNHKGLRDEKVIAFFDNHVHDSLADFDNDCTLPSDPRVVYVGGDKKMRHSLNSTPDSIDAQPVAA